MKLKPLLLCLLITSCNEHFWAVNSSIQDSTPSYVLQGVVSTLAGNPGSSGHFDSTGSLAQFGCGYGITADPTTGTLYVADSENYVVRKVTLDGVVTTFAGTPGGIGNINGSAATAKFGWINAIVIDSNGNLFLADGTNNSIRKVTPAGVVSNFSTDPDLIGIYGLSIDKNNNIYVSVDVGGSGSDKLLKFNPTGFKTVIKSDFDQAIKVVYDNNTDSIYVAGAHVIYKLDSNLNMTLFAGGGALPGNQNGNRTDVTFDWNWDMAIGQDGSLYVMDAGNYILRRIDTNGYVTQIAGTFGASGAVDGTGTGASFHWVEGITIGKDGYVYIVDCGNNTIRVVQ